MPVKIIMPKVDMVMETGTFMEWLKKEGEQVTKGDALFVIMTDKSAIECESPGSGTLAGLTAKPDDVIPVTDVIGYILAPGETLVLEAEQPALKAASSQVGIQTTAPATQQQEQPKPAPQSDAALVRATPLARRLARELGIDLASIQGRGERGRVYQADVKQAAASHAAEREIQPGQVHKAGIMEIAISGPDAKVRQRVALTGARAIIAQRMSYSAAIIPHIYESITVDAGRLYSVREQEKDGIQEATGRKLTYTGLMAFILSRVLPNHAYLNSSLIGDEIILWEDINIGLATDLGEYLIVPVIRQAQKRDLAGITAEMGSLLEDARSRKLNPEKMRNGTFTISNLGMYGIDSFTAIINPPEAAILAMGRIVETPMVNGSVYRTMKLVLGADHRVVDGGKAARFLMDLKAALEDPSALLTK